MFAALALVAASATSCEFPSKFSAQSVFPAGPARTIALLAQSNRLPAVLPPDLKSGINYVGKYELSPLLWAVTDDQVKPQTVGILVKNGADAFYWSQTQRTSAIRHSIQYGPVAELAEIVRNVPDIDTNQGSHVRDEPTALFSAVGVGSVPKVELLLTAGASLETRNDLGETPLLYARIGQLDVMAALLRAEADPRSTDDRGRGICDVLSHVTAPSRRADVEGVVRQLQREGVDCRSILGT